MKLGASCAWIALSLVLLHARPARAAASARLVYVRGPGGEQCPEEVAIRAAVHMRLGYDPFYEWARETLFLDVTRVDGVFRVRIMLVGADNLQLGAREIAAREADCSAVVDAMALTISLAIDPASITGPTTPPPPENPVADAPDPPPTVPPAAPSPELAPAPMNRTEHAAAPLEAWVGAAGLGSLGAAPAPAFGGVVSAGIHWRGLSWALEGRADLSASGASLVRSVRIDSRLLAGALVPCVHFGRLLVCGVVSLGALTAQSEGASSPHTSSALWWAIGPRVGVDLPLSTAISVDGYTELLWSPAANSAALDGASVYDFSSLSAGVGIGVAWRFL